MFHGDRIVLRAVAPSDLPTFHRWWSDPEIARFQTSGPIRLNREETNISMFERWFADSGADVGFAIVRREDETLIGFCNLWGATVKNRSAQVGILIDRPFWNQGYGTDAMRILLSYAFTELNLHRVQLAVFAFNERALRVYQRLGFREVGRLRETTFRDGVWQDEVIMDLLQREHATGEAS